MADLNARIGELSECLKPVEHVNELEEYNEFLSNSVDDTRMSCDKTINTCGRKLIEFCKLYSLNILNGRIGDDKNIGNFTYMSTIRISQHAF